jgi:hypothetical protein
MKMDVIRFKARLIAPYFHKAPPEEVEKWAKNLTAAADKAYKHSKESIKTEEDFYQKIWEPAERGFVKSLGKIDTPAKQLMIVKYRANKKKAAERYFRKLKLAYQTPKFAESVEFGKRRYEESWIIYVGPLRGDKKSGIKGLGSLGAMALSADKDLEKFLKPDIDEIEGAPLCITSPDKTGKFRFALKNLIIRSGTFIIDEGYEPETIRIVTERLNQLAEQYRLTEIAPFSPNGLSYINFIVVEIPNPVKADEMIKQLGLEIQVANISNIIPTGGLRSGTLIPMNRDTQI